MNTSRARLLLAGIAAGSIISVGVLTSAQARLTQAAPVTVQSIPALPLSRASGGAAVTQTAATTVPATTFQASPLAEHPGWRAASACFACHGTDGKDDTFGALNVFSKEDFMARMQELKTSEAENEGLMKPHSAGYTDAQIEQMADYFSQIE